MEQSLTRSSTPSEWKEILERKRSTKKRSTGKETTDTEVNAEHLTKIRQSLKITLYGQW